MIVNANGDVIPSLSMAAPPDTETAFTLRVQCRENYELTADSSDADVTIWAKANPGDAFQNIATTPIDLTPFFPATRIFYFECRIASGQPAETLYYDLIVQRS